MPITQQVIHSIKVKSLKNLVGLEMSFNGSPVTAILGPNGNGKSTVLHALACAFKPINANGENYKFSSFFLPNTDALWNGSELDIIHSYRDGRVEHPNVLKEYKKTEVRWTPIYARRPERNVIYIGIDKCVPMIESETKQAKINYSTEAVAEDIITTILQKASLVLNRRYSSYNIHTAPSRKFIGVEVDGLRYSALSMSAGEQKVFHILEKVFKAPKHSLILIDELDLLLHDKAMKKLIEVILARATDKDLQIIFTTHRESVLELESEINIRHIVSKAGKSLCFNETKPDAINRLTGTQPKPIEVFVEDDLASTIIKKVASQHRVARHLSVQRFGAAVNCFTTVAGLMFGGDDCANAIFVLDGDVYSTEEEKQVRLNKVITGHDRQAVDNRASALNKILQFVLPENTQPEKFLHSLIIGCEESDNEEFNEIIEVAREIHVVEDDHLFVSDIIDRLGWDKNIGQSKIIDLVATTDAWENYVSEVNDWMTARADEFREEANAA